MQSFSTCSSQHKLKCVNWIISFATYDIFGWHGRRRYHLISAPLSAVLVLARGGYSWYMRILPCFFLYSHRICQDSLKEEEDKALRIRSASNRAGEGLKSPVPLSFAQTLWAPCVERGSNARGLRELRSTSTTTNWAPLSSDFTVFCDPHFCTFIPSFPCYRVFTIHTSELWICEYRYIHLWELQSNTQFHLVFISAVWSWT